MSSSQYNLAQADKGVNLWTGKNSTGDGAIPEELSTSNETVIVSFLRPNVTLAVVDDFRCSGAGLHFVMHC